METTFKNPICSEPDCFGELDFDHPVQLTFKDKIKYFNAYPCKLCGRLYEDHES